VTTGVYALDNDSDAARQHHELLSLLWDTFSQQATRNLIDLEGRRCLEVGAGVGARFARWLAERVGDNGFVMATDIKPRNVPKHPRLAVVQDDITTGAARLDGGWDFIHARLTLGHIPDRRTVLNKLVTLLNPGGAILIEDIAVMPEHMVMSAPTPDAQHLYRSVQQLLTYRVFVPAGVDPTWACQIHGALCDEGLVDVRTDIHTTAWEGGGFGCQLVAGTIQQLRRQLIATRKVTEEQLDELLDLLDDSTFVLAGHLMFSTSGRKPESGE
jgi:SAM-dependent methyltransferase